MKLKRFFLLLLSLMMVVALCIPAYASSGESGSGTGSGAGGGSTTPSGGGTVQFSYIGVTMQVVTFPYKTASNRENSYNNVLNTIQSYKTANEGTTVYDGISTTDNTFMLDAQTGRVYRAPNFDKNTQTGTFYGAYGSGAVAIHPVEHSCVTVEMDGGLSYTNTTVAMPAMNNVEKFLQRIILGNNFGAWNVNDVALDANGKSLENNSKATAADDVSTFAQTLRYLGVSETLINNYVKGYSGQLSVSQDGDTPIPTIIWSYVMFENYGTAKTEKIAHPSAFYYRDSGSLAADVYLVANSKSYGYPYTCYTVGDLGVYSKGQASFDAWWKTGYSSSADCLAGYGACSWPYENSFICKSAFGAHSNIHTSYQQSPKYSSHMYGSGYINQINANGVDANTGKQFYFRGYWTPYGEIEAPTTAKFSITKSIDASDECIAQIQGNPMYSLAGAEYQVSVNGAVTETLTTDANGKAISSKEYEIGSVVTVKETKAPKGFKLNTTPYTFTIGTSNSFSVKDEPLFDPPFAITKVDRNTTNAQGNTSFSGAVFKWEYFANDSWSGDPQRTWYFQTDRDGYAFYLPSYLAADYTSDDLYIAEAGDHQIPLGTIRITELQNPLGYIVMPQPVLCSIVADDSTTSGTSIIWSEESTQFITDMTTGNFGLYEPIDETLFGSLTVEKVDALTGTAQGGATLEGAKFQVINNSTNSVKIGDFPEAAPGEVCYEFITAANGRHETGSIFPLGSYTVKEATPPAGYTLNSSWSQSFTVTADQQDFSFTSDNGKACPNTPIMGGVQIIKQDSLMGNDTGADALLEGITFSVISENEQPVVVNGSTHQKGETVLTMEVKWDGSRWTANSGEAVLPYGSYTVKENPMSPDSDQANDYYKLNTEPQIIKIEEHAVAVDLTFANALRPGKITLEKVNYEGEHLAGAKFLLEWSEDGEDWTPVTFSDAEGVLKGCSNAPGLENGCLITDEAGIITFSNLHPGLQYRVTELEAPEGYVLLADYAFVGELPVEDLTVALTVHNSQGYILPTTGESSFTFVVLGSCLVVASLTVAVFVTWKHRRKKAQKN